MTMSRMISRIAEDAQFDIQIRQALLAAQRNARPVGLLIINFASGDASEESGVESQEIREKAFSLIGGVLRDSDTLCRSTGSAIAVLLSSIAHPDNALLVAEKILNRLDHTLEIEAHEFRARIGIAVFPDHGHSASSLLECADLALTSTQHNQERCVVYSPQFSGSARPALHARDLRQAILEDQLFVVYQPKIDMRSDRITGVEALTRWRHPVHGLIMPDEFIPLAERTGVIVPLTLWVLSQSIAQWRRWHDEGINLSIAVNLSMWNLDAPELPEQIAALLSSAAAPASRLELEITESAIMDDPQRAMRTLRAIRELGVHFSIDDFGTGYSSLAQLRKLTVNSIKIDKSFTLNMETDNDSAVIVRAIIDLGHNLGLKVIAEGVETLAAKEMLLQFGCDEAQGYYFSRPVSAADISRLIRNLQAPPTEFFEPANLDAPWASENPSATPLR